MKVFHAITWSVGLWNGCSWAAAWTIYPIFLNFIYTQEAIIRGAVCILTICLFVRVRMQQHHRPPYKVERVADCEFRLGQFASVYCFVNLPLTACYLWASSGTDTPIPFSFFSLAFVMNWSAGLLDSLVLATSRSRIKACVLRSVSFFLLPPRHQQTNAITTSDKRRRSEHIVTGNLAF